MFNMLFSLDHLPTTFRVVICLIDAHLYFHVKHRRGVAWGLWAVRLGWPVIGYNVF